MEISSDELVNSHDLSPGECLRLMVAESEAIPTYALRDRISNTSWVGGSEGATPKKPGFSKKPGFCHQEIGDLAKITSRGSIFPRYLIVEQHRKIFRHSSQRRVCRKLRVFQLAGRV
ncbi:hypothetical protein ACE1CM_30440 [Microseira sp. BLCC-F43]